MNTQHILLIAGVVALAGGAFWLGTTRNAEAPTTVAVEQQMPVENIENLVPPEDAIAEMAQTEPAPTPKPAPTTNVAPAPKPVVSTPVKTTSKPAFTLVTYNGKGFSPNKVTVTLGDTVRFMNLSDGDMWIAADHHPTHTTYPVKTDDGCSPTIFDMCESIGINKYWDFRFDREGTFGYHNHEKAVINGEVEVNLPNEKPSIPGY